MRSKQYEGANMPNPVALNSSLGAKPLREITIDLSMGSSIFKNNAHVIPTNLTYKSWKRKA